MKLDALQFKLKKVGIKENEQFQPLKNIHLGFKTHEKQPEEASEI